jgi:MerR family transcriptional regulator, redox-sensitive transcriptional activator SoxR
MLTIGQVASRAGVRTSRIRYYEDVGVLPPAARVSGHRRYGEDIVRKLSIISAAQRAGLSLTEIGELIRPTDGRPAGEDIRAIADRRLPEIDALIDHAQAVKRWLEVARSCDCATVDVCGLFVDPALVPPEGDVELAIRTVGSPRR